MNTVDEIYDFTGNDLVQSISEDWANIELNIEAYLGDYVDLSGGYFLKSDEMKQLNLRSLDRRGLVKAIYKLLEIMTEDSEKNKWNRALFKISSDNKFSMEFEWDQKLDDEIKNA